MILFAISVIGVAFILGVIVGYVTRHEKLEAENETLAQVNLTLTWDITELQEQNHQLKNGETCQCAEHLDNLRRLKP